METSSHTVLEAKLNANVARPHRRLRFGGEVRFGEHLSIHRWSLGNGLSILIVPDPSAPVINYQTWFRVGSSHEHKGKTGQAHLLEHLMFNATKALPHGEFDRLIAAAGGESNAATWVDWTCYYENLPASELTLAVRLESDRIANLVLEKDKVASEKEVVASERRDRVEDDIDGRVSEVLYATAFGRNHPYGWPTIGWMRDIEGFTPADCRSFYRTHYAPNGATLIVAGHVELQEALTLIQEHYGTLAPSKLPTQSIPPISKQRGERTKELEWPTSTPKIAVGWHAPAYATYDHAVLTVIDQLMASGRSSRLFGELVRERELAAEVRMSIAPFRHAGLVDLWISSREGRSIDTCFSLALKQIHRLRRELVPEAELDKVKNRLELGFLGSLETASGKGDQIGFSETVVGDPAHTFARLAEYRRVSREDVRRVAREVFADERRTVIRVRPKKQSPRTRSKRGKA